jgi:phosphatidate cytidylyltransferase
MKRVLTAVVLIPVVLAIVFKAPLWLFALVVGAIIVLALHEYLGIVEAAGIKPFHGLTYAAGIFPTLLFLLYRLVEWQEGHQRQYFLYSDAYPWMRSQWALILLAPVIFGVPADSVQCILIAFLLFSVWAGDVGAYYIGRAFGRHKLAPVVSPNKSWEGAVASILASVVVAFVVFHFGSQLTTFFAHTVHVPFPPDSDWLQFPPWYTPPKAWHVLLIGILTNIAAQFGDLFESALKRGAGVKDSGALLPGHGGILDRIDALLFAIPVVWYYANLTHFVTKPSF